MSAPLLEFRAAQKVYGRGQGAMEALAPLDFVMPADKPEIVTIAGESGSGKSTLANLVLGFTKLTSGDVLFEGESIQNPARKPYLQRNIQAVFQDPFGVYNPFYRIEHVFELVVKNFKLAASMKAAQPQIEEALNLVGLRGGDVLRKYPHQLSGGQRQRIMMARACLLKPKLIVADEPVSMVDASLRSAILDVMTSLRDEHGISFLYITHDLATAYQIGDRILLLYQGQVAEQGLATDVIAQPKHPYVKLLIDSVPKADPRQPWTGEVELPSEEAKRGPTQVGCRFAPRCPHKTAVCDTLNPKAYPVGPRAHEASCILYDEERQPA